MRIEINGKNVIIYENELKKVDSIWILKEFSMIDNLFKQNLLPHEKSGNIALILSKKV